MERIRLNIFIIGLFTLAFQLNANSQLKKHIAPAVAVFVSGGFEGAGDYLAHYYDKPDKFWNKNLSANNKWKNGDKSQGERFPGSSTVFVFVTDGWHLMKFGRNLSMFTGFALYPSTFQKGKKWYWYVVEGLSYWAINRLGFNLTYNLLK